MNPTPKRNPQRAQERELPLFRWATLQERRPTYAGRPTYAERRLCRQHGLSVHRARLTLELMGLGGLQDGET